MTLWLAHQPQRDFREATWNSRRMQMRGSRATAPVPINAAPYTAIFGEATWHISGTTRRLSTNVCILDQTGQLLQCTDAAATKE